MEMNLIPAPFSCAKEQKSAATLIPRLFPGAEEPKAAAPPQVVDRIRLRRLLSVATMLSILRPALSLFRNRRVSPWVWLFLLAPIGLPQLSAQPTSQLPRGQRHESRREIDQLEESWKQAFLTANVAAMDSLLADDYMAITPGGTLQSKEQTLDHLRSGTIHLLSIDLTDRKVRFYGSTALVTSRAEVVGTRPSGEISGSYRYTRVYVRNPQGKWKIVSFEANRIRESGERKATLP